MQGSPILPVFSDAYNQFRDAAFCQLLHVVRPVLSLPSELLELCPMGHKGTMEVALSHKALYGSLFSAIYSSLEIPLLFTYFPLKYQKLKG
jgi:hypothetical protein